LVLVSTSVILCFYTKFQVFSKISTYWQKIEHNIFLDFENLKLSLNQEWWHILAIPALWRLRQKDLEVEARLGYSEFKKTLLHSESLSQKNV
jgi:hypothetical protein